MSDTSYALCSELDNYCLNSNTILLLRVNFFDKSRNKYVTLDIKAFIWKSTPFDLIIGRNTVKKHNLFDKVPSQLVGKVFTPTLDPTPKCNSELFDCLSESTLTVLLKSQTVSKTSSLLASLIVESENFYLNLHQMMTKLIMINLIRLYHS